MKEFCCPNHTSSSHCLTIRRLTIKRFIYYLLLIHVACGNAHNVSIQQLILKNEFEIFISDIDSSFHLESTNINFGDPDLVSLFSNYHNIRFDIYIGTKNPGDWLKPTYDYTSGNIEDKIEARPFNEFIKFARFKYNGNVYHSILYLENNELYIIESQVKLPEGLIINTMLIQNKKYYKNTNILKLNHRILKSISVLPHQQ